MPQSLRSFAMTGDEIAALRWRDRQKSAWAKRTDTDEHGQNKWRAWPGRQKMDSCLRRNDKGGTGRKIDPRIREGDTGKSAWGKRVPYGRRWRGWLAPPNVEWWGWRFWGGREGTRGKMALWGGIEFLWQFCSSFWGNGYNCAGYASKSGCIYGAKALL